MTSRTNTPATSMASAAAPQSAVVVSSQRLTHPQPIRRELRRSRLAPLLLRLYRWPKHRHLTLSVIRRLEGGHFFSATLREILAKYHGVEVGAYSYGECCIPGAFPPGVTIGRYVSIASEVRVFLRNHPMDRLSMHPFFFNSRLGYVTEDTIDTGCLWIGHDAWIGERTIITPGCSRIGIGAVIGAGAVVTGDVPDFAIVAGNPARMLRMRFSEEVCEAIAETRWWERSVDELLPYLEEVLRPLTEASDAHHPLLGLRSSSLSVRGGSGEVAASRP